MKYSTHFKWSKCIVGGKLPCIWPVEDKMVFFGAPMTFNDLGEKRPPTDFFLGGLKLILGPYTKQIHNVCECPIFSDLNLVQDHCVKFTSRSLPV